MYLKNVMCKDNKEKNPLTNFMGLTSILSSDLTDNLRYGLPKVKYLNNGSWHWIPVSIFKFQGYMNQYFPKEDAFAIK